MYVAFLHPSPPPRLSQLLSVGYGDELAQLDSMDLCDRLERLKRIENAV